MSMEIFNSILVLSAVVTSLGIEIIKALLDQFKIKYSTVIMSTITAFVLGAAEIFLYYGMHGLPVTAVTWICSLCMGAVNSVASNVGYDKVKEFLRALSAKAE